MIKLILLILFLAGNTFADISEFFLDNGLRVIVKTDKRSPIFISQLWYGVGSSDELNGITGISHLLEHMMFKSTKTLSSGELSRVIAKNGGIDNAFTSRDYTAYYQKIHKSKLELALKMEADRMQNLQLKQEDFIKERLVVLEERRMRIEDNPQAKAWEELYNISFTTKYQAPIIGYNKDLKSITLSDLKKWYKKYYAPNNATLVVVGDVVADEVFALADKYFSHYKKNHLTKFSLSANTAHNQHKDIVLKAKLPYFIMGFHAPSLNSIINKQEAYALELFAYLLDSELEKNLVRKDKILASVSVSYDFYSKYNSLFDISFVPYDGISTEYGKNEVLQQIKQIINNPNDFIEDIKNINTQIYSDIIYAQDSIDSQAYYLGKLATIGANINEINNYNKNITKVSPAQMASTAKKHLTNFNSVNLIPQ